MKKSLDFKKYEKEVTQVFLKSGKKYARDKEKYLRENNYKTKYRVYCIDKKTLKSLLKHDFSFSAFDQMEKAKIWSYIFKNTEYLELGDLAISYFKQFQNKKNHNLIQYWPLLKTWVNTIENWAHGDMVASLYCDILSEDPKRIYSDLKKWSYHKSPWKNRMAIVSLLYYYNPKRVKLPFKYIISLVEPHLEKDHYYLQKAIGWNLREISKAYPKESWKFINDNLYSISSVAFTTSMEKIAKNKKDILKEKRRRHRKSK